MDQGNLVQIRELTVRYRPERGTAVHAVDHVDLDIRSGEILGILGESGCGKSTLAHAVLRLLPRHARCESGTVLFRGLDLLRLTDRDLRRIRGKELALVPQDPALSLNPVMTVALQLAEVMRAHLPLDTKARRARSRELLHEVGFECPEQIESAYPHQLSGGQRQRVAIAQAVACRPALVIADEPTSKLDAPLELEIVALLSEIRRVHGTAIAMISHNPTLFAGFADRIAIMYAGRVVELGSAATVLRQPLHPYTQALVAIAKSAVLADWREPHRLPVIPGAAPDPTCMGEGCRFEPRCSERMPVCARQSPGEFTPQPERSVSCFKFGG